MYRTAARPAVDSDEAALVHAARAGDADALTQMFEVYAGEMERLARVVTGSTMEAEDVVQDLFMRLPDSLSTFEGRCPLASWLRRITVLRARMAVRARRRRSETRLDAQARASGSPDTCVDRIALERAIASLPERYRTVLILREVEGLSHEEIAQLLNTTSSVTCVTMCRARRRLRRTLDARRARDR